MRVTGNTAPEQICIEPNQRHPGFSSVRLRENVRPVGENLVEYDEYTFSVPDQTGIRAVIEANLSDWMATGRALEVKMNASVVADMKSTVDLADQLGGIRDDWTQSDRLGFDWHNYYINNELYRQDYVEQPYPYPGSADKPFPWAPDLQLIPNGYYTYNGERKVWTGEQGITADWTDSRFVVF